MHGARTQLAKLVAPITTASTHSTITHTYMRPCTRRPTTTANNTHPNKTNNRHTTRPQVTEGSGRMLVTAVGEQSEWGRTMALVVGEAADTPLQEKLAVLATAIGKLGLTVAVICFVVLMVRCVFALFLFLFFWGGWWGGAGGGRLCSLFGKGGVGGGGWGAHSHR